MSSNFTLAIPTPCHKKWEHFTPTQKGRFCASCQKEVIDFTTWNEEQIKQFFFTHPQSTCGRFAPHQLTTYTDYPATSKHPTRWAVALAFILLLARPTEAQTSRTITDQEQVDKINEDGLNQLDSVDRITIKGIVTSDDGVEALPGVNVMRKGSTQGTVTDSDGNFEMVIEQPKAVETLIVSFIGLTPVSYQVNADTALKEVKIAMHYDITGGIVLGGAVSVRRFSARGVWWRLTRFFSR